MKRDGDTGIKINLLDYKTPFVISLSDVIKLKAPPDTCVEILLAAEEKHGIRILPDKDESHHFLWGHTLIPKNGPLDLDGMLDMAIRDYDGFISRYREENDEDFTGFETRINRFLNEIPLLIEADHFAQNYIIGESDGSLQTFSIRNWGRFLAGWANLNSFMRPWSPHDYGDFICI